MAETSDDNIELVRRLFGMHNEGGDAVLEAYDEFFHPELEWVPAIVGGPERAVYRGKEGLAGWYADRDDSFGEATVEVEECRAVGPDVVVLLGRSLATGRASGAELNEEIGIVFGFEDGRIRIDRAYGSHREAEEKAEALAAEAHA